MEFDSATNEKINIGISPAPFNVAATDFSISCWVKSTQFGVSGSNFTLYSNSPSPFITLGVYVRSSSSTLTFGLNGAGSLTIPATDFSTTNWNHLVITVTSSGVNADRCKIYLNNVIYNRALGTNPVALSPSTPFTIGSRNGAIPIPGNIDQFTMFDYALSSTQVTNLYGNGTALTNPMALSPAPVYYAQLGDQSVDNGANYLVPNNSLNGSEGYSPYALSFDGTSNFLTLNNASNPFNSNTTLLGGTTSFTISAWFKQRVGNVLNSILGNYAGGFNVRSFWLFTFESNQIIFRSRDTNNNEVQISTPNNVVTAGSWQHISVTYDASDLKIFLNGVEKNTLSVSGITINTSIYADTIGSDDQFGGNFFDGELSNVAVWRNSVINPVTLYNNGKPANLNNLSTKPSYWFQLGSNSSFDSNTSKWTCLNEGTGGTIAMPLNATTYTGNMTNDDITNGVGYSANGLGTSSIDIVGDAPYSSGNGLSENMDVLDRVKDTPPT